MNISSENFNASASKYDNFYNGTMMETNLLYFVCVLLSFLTNSYVIWLIVTGTGNGLVAEFFILNLCVCEIFICVECVFLFLISKFEILWLVVSFLDGFSTTGRPLFQCLICVERYLAVVHPVIFLKTKPLRYRAICSGIAWVVTSGSSGIITAFVMSRSSLYIVFMFAQFSLFLSIQMFCLVVVLRALKQSGPGERRRDRDEENNMKRRAFHLILITTVTMLVIYGPYVTLMSFMSTVISSTLMSISSVCFILAGLVQPVFFLYRVKKLAFIKCQ